MRRILVFLTSISILLASFPIQSSEAQGGPFPITITDATGHEVTIESIDAIVSGSGDVSEILVALGFRDNLVAVDTTSTYPTSLLDELPAVGFGRRLAVEPILNQAPTVFFCTEVCGPPAVLDQLRAADIPVVIIPDNDSDGLQLPFAKITMVAQALGVEAQGELLKERLAREIDWVTTALANTTDRPSVFNPYLRGQGLQLAAGDGTPSHYMIEGAGGHNTAVDAGVEGYSPLSPEIILAAFPEYLILTDGNVEASGGLDAILDQQGLRQTPAAENGNILVMDTQLLLGMSMRTGQSLMELAQFFHPEMTWEVSVEYPYTVTDAAEQMVTVDAMPANIYASADALDLVHNLGFHADVLEANTLSNPEAVLIVATLSQIADWQPLAERGFTVIVIPDSLAIDETALLLNVPGRGTALEARLANE